MYFDTVCLAYLDSKWNLDKKVVQVVSPNIYFEKEENKILTPLHKASKCGTSSSDWNKAYQAVKHNRVKELDKGNIKSLLHGLAALFVLNLYYRDEKISGILVTEKNNVNSSFGSFLFSVKIHKERGLRADGIYMKHADYDECVYIEDYESESKKIALDAMSVMNEYMNDATMAEMVRIIKEKGMQVEDITKEWIDRERSNINKKIFPIKDYRLGKQITDGFRNLRYDVVLNKKQY